MCSFAIVCTWGLLMGLAQAQETRRLPSAANEARAASN
jgi:hypothetical protein